MLIHNLLILAASAAIPLVLGFIWYNPKVFGTAWMNAAGVTPDSAKGMNMALVFVLTFVLGFFLSVGLLTIVIHQTHMFSILANEPGIKDPNSDISKYLADFFAKYGNNFRTFKHGAFHGTIAGIAIALPIVAINAMFERKSFKYVAINAGFWIACAILMGGVICQFFQLG